MPKVSFSTTNTDSFDARLRSEGLSSSLINEMDAGFHNGSKDDKGKFSGKIKFPKVELSSPYTKMSSGEEDSEMTVHLISDSAAEGENKGLKIKSEKISFSSISKKKGGKGRGWEEEEEMEANVQLVSSHARTEMLDRDSSESPDPWSGDLTMDITPGRAHTLDEAEADSGEQESSPWFKVPKFTLKPHSTGTYDQNQNQKNENY